MWTKNTLLSNSYLMTARRIFSSVKFSPKSAFAKYVTFTFHCYHKFKEIGKRSF